MSKSKELNYKKLSVVKKDYEVNGDKVINYEFFVHSNDDSIKKTIGMLDAEENGDHGGCIFYTHLKDTDNLEDEEKNVGLQSLCETLVAMDNKGHRPNKENAYEILNKLDTSTLYKIQSGDSKEELIEDIVGWLEDDANTIDINLLLKYEDQTEKQAAKAVKDRLEKLGCKIPLGHAYEVLAAIDGYQSRNHVPKKSNYVDVPIESGAMPFDVSRIKRYKDSLYEELDSTYPTGHKYRVILNTNDYDYVEDKTLEATLNKQEFISITKQDIAKQFLPSKIKSGYDLLQTLQSMSLEQLVKKVEVHNHHYGKWSNDIIVEYNEDHNLIDISVDCFKQEPIINKKNETMTMKEAILAKYKEYNNKLFKNDQGGRLSGQGYTADPNKTTLTFNEFLDSYFGEARLSATESNYDSEITFDMELEHVGEVLADEVIEDTK